MSHSVVWMYQVVIWQTLLWSSFIHMLSMNESLFMNCFLGKMKMLSIDIRSKGLFLIFRINYLLKLYTCTSEIWRMVKLLWNKNFIIIFFFLSYTIEPFCELLSSVADHISNLVLNQGNLGWKVLVQSRLYDLLIMKNRILATLFKIISRKVWGYVTLIIKFRKKTSNTIVTNLPLECLLIRYSRLVSGFIWEIW